MRGWKPMFCAQFPRCLQSALFLQFAGSVSVRVTTSHRQIANPACLPAPYCMDKGDHAVHPWPICYQNTKWSSFSAYLKVVPALFFGVMQCNFSPFKWTGWKHTALKSHRNCTEYRKRKWFLLWTGPLSLYMDAAHYHFPCTVSVLVLYAWTLHITSHIVIYAGCISLYLFFFLHVWTLHSTTALALYVGCNSQ